LLQPDSALVALTGEHDLYSANKLQRTLDEALAVYDHLIVDLYAAAFIDSSIVAVLIQTKKNATQLGRKFNVVLGTAPVVERILFLTGVVPFLNVVPTVEQAVVA
jgi:anti-sigma B factor antagonist